MADENDIASGFEQVERDHALKAHASRMAAIKPADDCKHCGEPLACHRQPWGSCIDCASHIELLAGRIAR